MNSEKVKEIKEALQDHSIEKLKYQDGIKIKELDFFDILTYINELESENERLNKSDTSKEESSIEYYNLYRDFKRENQQLKDRIAELEKENGELKEHVAEVEKGIINIAKERNKKDELASKFIDSYNDSLKQFAERLKEKALSHCRTINCYELKFIETTIDELLDEILKEYIDEE